MRRASSGNTGERIDKQMRSFFRSTMEKETMWRRLAVIGVIMLGCGFLIVCIAAPASQPPVAASNVTLFLNSPRDAFPPSENVFRINSVGQITDRRGVVVNSKEDLRNLFGDSVLLGKQKLTISIHITDETKVSAAMLGQAMKLLRESLQGTCPVEVRLKLESLCERNR
jgi:hypothetical protein